jgi:hypothetical protein
MGHVAKIKPKIAYKKRLQKHTETAFFYLIGAEGRIYQLVNDNSKLLNYK